MTEPNTTDTGHDLDPLSNRAKALFDESVEGLDAATLSRLNRNRHAALAQATRRPTRLLGQWIPAAGVAAAAVVAVVIWSGNPAVEQLPGSPVVADSDLEFEILLEGDDFEMLEDLEFYSWMDLTDEPVASVADPVRANVG